jgi:hypothetical protein
VGTLISAQSFCKPKTSLKKILTVFLPNTTDIIKSYPDAQYEERVKIKLTRLRHKKKGFLSFSCTSSLNVIN